MLIRVTFCLLQGLEQAVMAGDTGSRGGPGGEAGAGGTAAEKKKAKKDAAAEDVRLERLLRCGAYEVSVIVRSTMTSCVCITTDLHCRIASIKST